MVKKREMTLLEHLDELRRRLFYTAIVVLAATMLCFYAAYPSLKEFIMGPLAGLDPNTQNFWAKNNPLLNFLRPHLMQGAVDPIKLHQSTFMEAFVVKFKLSMLGGFVISAPFIFYQMWAFIGTGLLPRERGFIIRYLPLSLILFVLGLAFGYYVAMPVAMIYLLSVDPDVENILMIGPYFSQIMVMLLMFGFAFELPLVTLALAKLGLVPAASLARGRRYAIVAIFILAAVLTPSPEPFSQCLLAIPMVGLYELGIFLAKRAEKKG